MNNKSESTVITVGKSANGTGKSGSTIINFGNKDVGNTDNKMKNYETGKIKKFIGIKEGIENTNYLIQTDKNKFILTIYEKRVNTEDLPFFIRLMTNLYNLNFKCPKPITDKNGNYISEIFGKKAAVVSFIEGSAKKNLNPENCYDIGVETAKLHKITKNLSLRRQNNLSLFLTYTCIPVALAPAYVLPYRLPQAPLEPPPPQDQKSTRLNSSHW